MSKGRALVAVLFGVNVGLDIALLTTGGNYWGWLGIDIMFIIILFTLKIEKNEVKDNE